MSNKQSAKQAKAQREAAAAARRKRTRVLTGVVAAIALLGLVAAVVVPLLTSNNDTTADAGVTDAQNQPQAQETIEPDNSADDPIDDVADPDAATTDGGVAASLTAPDPELAEGRAWTATISTNHGDLTLELDGAAAPQAVASFVALANDGFFDGTDCHRLVTAGIFVLQCGDPTGTGTGGPAYRFGPIENAPADDIYPAGTLAMARVGGNAESMGSQFFIVYEDSPIPSDNAGGYSVFGHVSEGLSIVEDVASAGTMTGQPDGQPAQSVIVNEVSAS